MSRKLVLTALTLAASFSFCASALADVPMPECVGNPACNQNQGCSIGTPAVNAGEAGLVALFAAAALVAARRRAR